MNRSLYMSPSFTSDNRTDNALPYTKTFGKVNLGFPIGISVSNIANQIFSQFTVWVAIAKKARSATLQHFISVVFDTGSQEKVARINTSRIVAPMENTHIFWNFPEGKFVGNTMCEQIPFVDNSTTVTLPVQFGSSPFPTFVRGATVNFRPETIFDCIGRGLFGMIRHIGNSLLVIGHALGRYSGAGAFSCLNYNTTILRGATP